MKEKEVELFLCYEFKLGSFLTEQAIAGKFVNNNFGRPTVVEIDGAESTVGKFCYKTLFLLGI